MVRGLGNIQPGSHAQLFQLSFEAVKRAVAFDNGLLDALGDGDFGRDFGFLPSVKLPLHLAKLAGSQSHLLLVPAFQPRRDGQTKVPLDFLRGLDATQAFPFARPDFAPVVHPARD